MLVLFSSRTITEVVVAFAQPTYSVREDEGPVLVCVEIVARSLAPGLSATVSISSVDGSATRECLFFCR